MRDTVAKIKSEETWDPLSGTSRVFFDEGDQRYSVEASGSRYLIAVNVRPGKIGSIIVPPNYRNTETSGFVVGLGDGVWDPETEQRVPPPRKIGDMVLFGEYAGSKVELGGREFRIMPYDSIIGVLHPERSIDDQED